MCKKIFEIGDFLQKSGYSYGKRWGYEGGDIMKRMNYGNMACKVSVSENYVFCSEAICAYDKDTVAYAVERFFECDDKERIAG